MKKISLLLVLMLVIPFFKISAQDKKAGIYDITESQLNAFIKILPEFKNMTENTEPSDANLFLMAIKNTPVQQLNDMAKKAGFKDEKELIAVAGGVLVGYSVIKLKEVEKEMDKEMKSLPQEMQAAIKAQIDMIKAQTKNFESQISKNTISLVEKNYKILDKILSEENEND